MSEIKYTQEGREYRQKQLGQPHSLNGVCRVYNSKGQLKRIEKTS